MGWTRIELINVYIILTVVADVCWTDRVQDMYVGLTLQIGMIS